MTRSQNLRIIAFAFPFVMLPALLFAQTRDLRGAPLRSAAITNVKYTVTFKALQGVARVLDMAMSFTATGSAKEPVLLGLPVWTPGSYEVAYFARNITGFTVTQRGQPVHWDKADPVTWRIFAEGAGEVQVAFRYHADTLDNGASWARDEFALFNGTNLFLYPAGRGTEFPATVHIETEDGWRVTTGLTEAAAPRSWTTQNYHDLVDHPFFVGRFDLDSAMVSGVWFRLSSYPTGSVKASQRLRLFDQLGHAIPKEIAVFGDNPWRRYEIMQIADSSVNGMSALEHENSNVAVIAATLLDEAFVPSVYAHEIFHAFNVKRLRPIDMWPYRYDQWEPTAWLWVSEGITDYYADLALVRGGVTTVGAFLATTQEKIDRVNDTAPIALEDASLQAWIGMTDGTSDIYYPKGSLAGLALDILIRDASNNAASLDNVMRELYKSTYKNGRGFTGEDWWGAVSRAARGMSFTDFIARYVDGRAPFPWTEWLSKAGWRIRSDTTREARLGVTLAGDSAGVRVMTVDPTSVAAGAGIQPGDVLTAIGGISTKDPQWQNWRGKYAKLEGTALPITLIRGGKPMNISAIVRLAVLINQRLEDDPAAGEKAKRNRAGIIKG